MTGSAISDKIFEGLQKKTKKNNMAAESRDQ